MATETEEYICPLSVSLIKNPLHLVGSCLTIQPSGPDVDCFMVSGAPLKGENYMSELQLIYLDRVFFPPPYVPLGF